MFPQPVPGHVISYVNLWQTEHQRGHKDGLENRLLTITQNANVTGFANTPDGERAGKSFGGNAYSYLGNGAEFLVNSANPGCLRPVLPV